MDYVSSIPASYKWTVVSLSILKSHLLRVLKFCFLTTVDRSQWPHLRRGYGVARLLGLRFRIPPRSWKCVPCECCVLSGRGLCVGLITRPEESCRVHECLSVTVKPGQWEDPCPVGAVAPQGGKWWTWTRRS